MMAEVMVEVRKAEHHFEHLLSHRVLVLLRVAAQPEDEVLRVVKEPLQRLPFERLAFLAVLERLLRAGERLFEEMGKAKLLPAQS